MAKLYCYNNQIFTVFELLGYKENDMSYSLGWALSNSYHFMKKFLTESINFQEDFNHNDVIIRLQSYGKGGGFTDLEIELSGILYIIIEVKKGWVFPSNQQLEKYASRESIQNSCAKIKKIITLTESTPEYAEIEFKIKNVKKIEVSHLSWKSLLTCANKARENATYAEKRLLDEFKKYLEGIMTKQNIYSNWVFVVSLGNDIPTGWNISFKDIVNKKNMYFHPAGNGWPVDPPNYIAFRYTGQLQSIHHIEKYEIFKNPHKYIEEIPSEVWEKPCFIYFLGKPFMPSHEVKSGKKIKRSMRVWCMLDTLFTTTTIEEAWSVTKARERL